MKDEFISIKQAAQILGVSPKTLRRWEEKRILSPHRTMGNQRRYSLRDVENLKQKKPTFPKPLILPASPIARPEQPVLANEIINPTPSSLPSPKPSSEVVSHESLKTQQRFALSSF